MLKIKDNVDLKELEKYGFEYNNRPFYDTFTGEKKINPYYSDEDGTLIREYDREICFIRSDLLYDLIKADLVEKVGD